jgi:hypothetical protein
MPYFLKRLLVSIAMLTCFLGLILGGIVLTIHYKGGMFPKKDSTVIAASFVCLLALAITSAALSRFLVKRPRGTSLLPPRVTPRR